MTTIKTASLERTDGYHHKYMRFNIAIASLVIAFFFTSCDSVQPIEADLPAEKIEFNLPVVEGSQQLRLTIHNGSESAFDVEIDGLRNVPFQSAPFRHGWSVFPDRNVPSVGARFGNMTLLDTRNSEDWKPINYLLNVRREFAADDDRITDADIQAAIWVLSRHVDFDPASANAGSLPAFMVKNGAPLFSVSVVNDIVQQVERDYRAYEPGLLSVHAVVGRAGSGSYGLIVETGAYRVDVTDLKETAGLSVAWGINNQGQITGGNLFYDPAHGTTNMGNVFARAINDHGMVVGNRGNSIVIWRQGDSNIEVNAPGGIQLEAHDINNSGQVVGELVQRHLIFEDEYGDYYDYEYKGFVWDFNHNIRHINENGWASSINDHGEVTGLDFGIQNRAYKWDEQRGLRGLGSYSGYSSGRPNGLNNNGHLVGSILVNSAQAGKMAMNSAMTADGRPGELSNADQLQSLTGTRGAFDHAHVAEMLRSASFSQAQEVMDLLGSSAVSSEEAGSLAWSIGSRSEAFLWNESEGITRIGTLGGDWSTAWDVNDRGQVVGYSSVQPGVSKAYIWDRDHGMLELPGLGGNSLARSINDSGEIVGYSYDEQGRFVPVKWTVTWIGL